MSENAQNEVEQFDPAADSIRDVDLEEFDEEDQEPATPVADDDESQPEIILPSDPKWTEHVMSHFTDDEIYDGYPTCDGLRRVCELLLGETVTSRPVQVVAPSSANGFHAMVVWEYSYRDRYSDQVKVFGDAADVCPLNTEHPYWIHATATASTKAEGRAYKKALRLVRIHSAEEMTEAPEVTGGRTITQSQINFIDMKCHDLDIDALRLINAGQTKYASVSDVPYQKAVEIFHYLNQVQIGTKTAPTSLKGYKADWKPKPPTPKE